MNYDLRNLRDIQREFKRSSKGIEMISRRGGKRYSNFLLGKKIGVSPCMTQGKLDEFKRELGGIPKRI